MSLLPTAHAGQSFGSRRIDFFTVSGEVSSSDAGIGRVTDGDGVTHEIKLIERSSAFAKGDSATVLRVQSGPNRRSRPVAIINHSRGLWMRAAPDATSTLARSGVTRTLNWWLSILALALIAIAVAWPSLHVFLTELNGAMMAGIPAFDIYAELGAPLPGLASWRLETALSPGLFDAISALGVVPMEQLTEWGLTIAVAALSLIAFFARSWRLVYVPALAVLCVFSGAILGSPVVSLAMIGGAVSLFIIGGFINRVRDSGRFNARVERLAEYILGHPPEEGVRASEPARAEASAAAPLAAAAAATAIATAAAVAEGDDREAVEPEAVEPEMADAPETLTADDTTPAEPAQSGANGEIAGDGDDATDDSAAAAVTLDDDTAPAEPAESGANGEVAAEAANEAEPASESAAQGDPDADPGMDDDLPSLEAVAAAAALNDIERTGSGENAAPAAPAALDDDRTMAVAAPPPMPATPAQTPAPEPATGRLLTETPIESPLPIATRDDAAANEPADTEIPAEASAPAAEQADEPAQAIAMTPAPAEAQKLAEAQEPVQIERDEPVAAEPVETPAVEGQASEQSETAEPAAGGEPAPEPAMSAAEIDDPMIEDDGDPMVEKASGDFAPGAPEIELDREPAQ